MVGVLLALAALCCAVNCRGDNRTIANDAGIVVFENTPGRLPAAPDGVASAERPAERPLEATERYHEPVLDEASWNRLRQVVPELRLTLSGPENPLAVAHAFVTALQGGDAKLLRSLLAPHGVIHLPDTDAEEVMELARARLPATIGAIGWGAMTDPPASSERLTIQVALAPQRGQLVTLVLLMQWLPLGNSGRWAIADARRMLLADAEAATFPLIARYAEPQQSSWPQPPQTQTAPVESQDDPTARDYILELVGGRVTVADTPVVGGPFADLFPSWVSLLPGREQLVAAVEDALADAPVLVDSICLHRGQVSGNVDFIEWLLVLDAAGRRHAYVVTLQRRAGDATWRLADFSLLLTRADLGTIAREDRDD